MYEQFYEMKHTPFTRSIPISALHKTRQSAEVFSRLEYTARNQLFAVLIGESGTGKTSTLRRPRPFAQADRDHAWNAEPQGGCNRG